MIDAPLSTAGPDPLHEIPVSGGTITLTVNGGSGVLSLGADLTTANGAITIDAPVVVTANVAIDATAGGDTPGASVTLAGTVDASSVAAGEVLVLDGGNGTVTIEQDIGSGTALGSLYVDTRNGAAVIEGSVTTTGEQSYNGGTLSLQNVNLEAGGEVLMNSFVTIGPGTTRISGGDIAFPYVFNGPGALVLTAGPATGNFDDLAGFDFPITGNILLNEAGMTTSPASLTATAAGAIAIENIITTGPQTYIDQTLYLMDTLYPTNGTGFTEHGATILGIPPLDQGDGGGAVTTDGDYVGTVGIITTGDGGGGQHRRRSDDRHHGCRERSVRRRDHLRQAWLDRRRRRRCPSTRDRAPSRSARSAHHAARPSNVHRRLRELFVHLRLIRHYSRHAAVFVARRDVLVHAHPARWPIPSRAIRLSPKPIRSRAAAYLIT